MRWIEKYLVQLLTRQVEALEKYQIRNLWHTIINDPTSYLEASATSVLVTEFLGGGYRINKCQV